MNENENNVEVVEETTVETTYEEPQVEVAENCECAEPCKKSKKLLPLICIGGAVVAVAVALAIIFSTPWMLVSSGIKNSARAIQKNEVISLMTDVGNGGSVEEVVDLKKLVESNEEMSPNGMELDGTVSMKYYTDISKAAMAMTVSYKKDSKDVLDASIHLDKENVAIASEALLGDDAYGISLKDFTKNLKDSVFGPKGEYYIGDEVFDILESIDPAEWEELDKDTQKLVKSIYKETLKTIKKNSTAKKSNKILSFSDKDTRVTAVTIQMDDDQMVDFLKDMLKYLQKDKQLKDYLEKHDETLLFAVPDMDAEDAVDAFYDGLDELEDELEDFEDEVKDVRAKLDVTFYVTKLTRQVVGFEVKPKEDGETLTKITFLAGPNLKNAREISLSVDDEEAYYRVTTDNAKAYEAKLEIPGEFSGKVSYDKKTGEFKIQAKEDSEEIFRIAGTIEKAKKEVSIALDSITVEEETVEIKGAMTMILRTEDAVPAMPAYKEVLKMDMDDIQAVAEDVMTAAQELGQEFMQ